MSELEKKSIHDLRSIAQAFGVDNIFEKEPNILRQEIAIKQQSLAAPKPKLPEKPIYDARLMDEAPNKVANPLEIVEVLKPYIHLGLRVELGEETWTMNCGLKFDSGTMRMPLKDILNCARRLMQ